jgi:hypothetical protein
MPTLTFRFSLDKVINALAFFAEQGVKDLNSPTSTSSQERW